jgi:thiamine biosynthesis lipoprotein
LALAGCGRPTSLSQSFEINGVPGTVTVRYEKQPHLNVAFDLARGTAFRVNRDLNSNEPDSELAKVNKIANLVRYPLKEINTLRILKHVGAYAELTDGAFDVTMYPIARLWGFADEPPPEEPPNPDVLKAAITAVGPERYTIAPDGTISYASPLIRIDLGDLIHAYAVDLSILLLRQNNIPHVMMTMASNARALGTETDSRPWQVALPGPYVASNSLGMVRLEGGSAVSTVNLYSRSVTIDGRRYGSVLDPKTGLPAQGFVSVSVLGPTATEAYALAQALLVVGTNGCDRILGRAPRYEAMLIPDRQPVELTMTPGFARRFAVAPAYSNAVHLLPAPVPSTQAQPKFTEQ